MSNPAEVQPEIPEAANNEGLTLPARLMDATQAKVFGLMVLASSTRAGSKFGIVETRGQIPEPFDIVNHSGNLTVTYAVATAASKMFWSNKKPRLEAPEDFSKRRRILAGGVAAGAIALNSYAELVGYGSASTPDTIDFAYGMLGAYVGYKVVRPKYITPETIAYVDSIASEEAESKGVVKVKSLLTRLRKERNEEFIKKQNAGHKPKASSKEKHLKNKRRRKNRKSKK